MSTSTGDHGADGRAEVVAVDWLLNLRSLQRQGFTFAEALDIANREAEGVTR